MKSKTTETAHEKAIRLIGEMAGIFCTAEALRMGIHPRTLYALRDSGVLEQLSRGVFRLTDQEPVSNPDLIMVAVRCPKAIICLVSALSFHEITTQVPHVVSIALERGADSPKIDNPPLSIHRFSKESLVAGIEQHEIDGVTVHVYSPEKTLADCFKFRNKIGMDIVLEALKLYRTRKEFKVGKLLEYARICRVEGIIKPYLETLI